MSKRAIADVSTAAGPKRGASDPSPLLVPALIIVAHPSSLRAGERLLLDALRAGREVAVSRNAPDFVKPDRALGLPLGDPFVSRKPIRFAPSREGGVRLLAGDGGPVTLAGTKVRDSIELGPDDLAAGVPIELAERVVLLLHLASREAAPTADELGMVGESVGIRRVRAHLERIADLSVPVLIRGETGTGKEPVARAVHTHGPQRTGPFVSVNLGAVPRELAAAELFGAQTGAYTGATRDREGLPRRVRADAARASSLRPPMPSRPTRSPRDL